MPVWGYEGRAVPIAVLRMPAPARLLFASALAQHFCFGCAEAVFAGGGFRIGRPPYGGSATLSGCCAPGGCFAPAERISGSLVPVRLIE